MAISPNKEKTPGGRDSGDWRVIYQLSSEGSLLYGIDVVKSIGEHAWPMVLVKQCVTRSTLTSPFHIRPYVYGFPIDRLVTFHDLQAKVHVIITIYSTDILQQRKNYRERFEFRLRCPRPKTWTHSELHCIGPPAVVARAGLIHGFVLSVARVSEVLEGSGTVSADDASPPTSEATDMSSQSDTGPVHSGISSALSGASIS